MGSRSAFFVLRFSTSARGLQTVYHSHRGCNERAGLRRLDDGSCTLVEMSELGATPACERCRVSEAPGIRVTQQRQQVGREGGDVLVEEALEVLAHARGALGRHDMEIHARAGGRSTRDEFSQAFDGLLRFVGIDQPYRDLWTFVLPLAGQYTLTVGGTDGWTESYRLELIDVPVYFGIETCQITCP